MRRKITALLFITIILTIPCYSAIGAENNPLIDISREVNIQLRGITSILDTITIKAPVGESTTIQSLWIGNLDLYNPELVQFEMKQGNSWIPLTFESETRLDYNGYLVEFPALQTISDLENIVIQAKFTHIDLIFQTTSNVAFIPAYPIFEYNITSLTLSIQLPESSEYESYEAPFNITNNNNTGDIWQFNYNSTDIDDWQNSTLMIQYIPTAEDNYILYFESLKHEVEIKQDYIIVSETYELRNLGNGIQSFYTNIPSQATDIWAHDHVGTIFIESLEGDISTDPLEIVIDSRGVIFTNNKWMFTLSYRLPNDGYVSEQTLTYKISNYEYYIKELKASIIIPEGGEYISSTPEPNNIDRMEDTRIQYTFGQRLPQEEDSLSVDFTLSTLNTWIRPLAAIILTAGFIGGVIYLRRQKSPESIIKVKDKSENPKVSEYINQYKDRLSTLKEYYKLQEQGKDKEGKLAEIYRQLDNNLRKIKQEETKLNNGEITQQLKSIQKAEQDIANIKKDLNNLETRLRTRRISRRDFERRRESRVKRLQQAIEAIEKELISLSK